MNKIRYRLVNTPEKEQLAQENSSLAKQKLGFTTNSAASSSTTRLRRYRKTAQTVSKVNFSKIIENRTSVAIKTKITKQNLLQQNGGLSVKLSCLKINLVALDLEKTVKCSDQKELKALFEYMQFIGKNLILASYDFYNHKTDSLTIKKKEITEVVENELQDAFEISVLLLASMLKDNFSNLSDNESNEQIFLAFKDEIIFAAFHQLFIDHMTKELNQNEIEKLMSALFKVDELEDEDKTSQIKQKAFSLISLAFTSKLKTDQFNLQSILPLDLLEIMKNWSLAIVSKRRECMKHSVQDLRNYFYNYKDQEEKTTKVDETNLPLVKKDSNNLCPVAIKYFVELLTKKN